MTLHHPVPLYSPFPRRCDSKCSLEYKTKSKSESGIYRSRFLFKFSDEKKLERSFPDSDLDLVLLADERFESHLPGNGL